MILSSWPIDDENYADWIASICAHPVLGLEYGRLLEMGSLLASDAHRNVPPAVRFGRFYQQVYEPSDQSAQVIDRSLRMAAARLKVHDRLLTTEHFPVEFVGKVSSESRVANTFSPTDLIDTALHARGEDPLSRRRQIEAIPRYIMARLMFAVSEVESEVDVGEQAEDAFDTIMHRLFAAGRSGNLFLRAWLDERRAYRCGRLTYALEACPLPEPEQPGYQQRTHEIVCRFMYFEGSLYPVLFDDRVKDDFSTALKMMRKGVPLIRQIDKRGLTIIAMSAEDLIRLEQAFKVAVSVAPFSIRERPHGQPGVVVDPSNPYSTLDFKARRYELDFRLADGTVVPVEANLQQGEHFIDTLFSRTSARHSVYRLNQLCDQYFPLRFPRFVCGVDFRDGSADRQKLLDKLWS